MRKILNFTRSMRSGLILLTLVAVFSVVGSVIPQGHEISWYAQNYSSAHALILSLRLNDVFNSWYFALVMALLCLNLTLCSVLRIKNVVRAADGETRRSAALPDERYLTAEGLERLRDHLQNMHCRIERVGDCAIYTKNGFGRYGSFITHLAILLTVVLGAAALYLPTVTDRTCLPGESVVMDDGTRIRVADFRIEDSSGRLDFTSRINVTLPDGRQSGEREIKVNYPLSFGEYKIYQQTYATAGAITVTNPENGGVDELRLTETVFLSLDGVNGVWYQGVYPDFMIDPSGNVTIVSSSSGHYENPVYEAIIASDGDYMSILAFPGDEIEVGGLSFRFDTPVEYPGLRIKHTPGLINALLLAAFVLMIAGLYVTFFCEPVLVKTDGEGYAVGGTKPERMRIELSELLSPYETTEEEEK